MRMLAPVAIFAYNRPSHLKKMLESLAQSECFDETPFYVFVDGPKNEFDSSDVSEVINVVNDFFGDKAHISISIKNVGLATSIINGVSQVLERYDSIIVVEDDLILSPLFLSFMNASLKRYKDTANVYQVSGHVFDLQCEAADAAFFLPYTTTWGWATWKRAWSVFSEKVCEWESFKSNAAEVSRFNLNGSYPFTFMMDSYLRGKNNSWGIRWYWSVYQSNGLVLFPPVTLVINSGFDGSGTHGSGLLTLSNSPLLKSMTNMPIFPEVAKIDYKLLKRFCDAVYRQNGGLPAVIINRLREFVLR